VGVAVIRAGLKSRSGWGRTQTPKQESVPHAGTEAEGRWLSAYWRLNPGHGGQARLSGAYSPARITTSGVSPDVRAKVVMI